MKEGYSRKVGTDWIEIGEVTEVVNRVHKYLEKKHYYVRGRGTFKKKFMIKEENKITDGRVGITIMDHNDDPHVTYHRFQIMPSDSPLRLDYCIELRIGHTRSRKSSVDKVVKKILELHPLLKEQKEDNVIIY